MQTTYLVGAAGLEPATLCLEDSQSMATLLILYAGHSHFFGFRVSVRRLLNNVLNTTLQSRLSNNIGRQRVSGVTRVVVPSSVANHVEARWAVFFRTTGRDTRSD